MNFSDITVSDVTAAMRFKTSEKAWISTPRAHHILAYQLSGDVPHDFGNRNLKVKADTVLFFNKTEVYSAVQREPCESIAIHFTSTDDVDIPSFVLAAKNPAIKTAFERLYAVYMRFDASDRHRIMSMTYDLLYLIDALRHEGYHPKSSAITRVEDYIRAHFGENISTQTLSEIYGVTPRRLNDIFKSAYGLTPGAYVLEYRLNIAKNLLEHTTLSISEIAEQSGFSDITYFSRIFKNKLGITPSRYRQKSTAQ